MENTTEITSLKTHYSDTINGKKTIILLHGWGQSYAFWSTFIKKYQKYFRTIAIDLPGFGMSDEPPGAWDYFDYADFIHEFVIRLSIKKPILIGHSFGGKIALAYAAKYPLHKLILYSTDGGVTKEFIIKKLYRNVLVRIGRYLYPELIYKFQTKWFKPNSYENNTRITRTRARRMLDIYTFMNKSLEVGMLAKIQAKTLIITGEKDYISNPETGEVLEKEIRYSKLIKIAKASHFAHLERPAKFFKSVDIFIFKNSDL